MIRINLLPIEYRHGRRVSARLIGVSFASVLAVSASIGWFGVTYFGRLGEVERAHAAVQQKLQERGKLASYFDRLESNQKDYQNRVDTIQTIGRSRMLWSKFMDEFIDVINKDSDVDRHIAWFDSMTVKGDPKKGTTITLPGAVQGNEMAKVANLHESIQRARFWEDVQSMSEPSGRAEVSKDRTPPESLRFQLTLQLAPRTADKAASAKKAAKTPAKKG
ncbi:MAG: hypothetical protein Fur0037_21980 [Planctomycetota bacterium]